MVCVRFTKMWPTTKIQVRDISKILKSVCVGPSPKKVGGSSNAIKRVGGGGVAVWVRFWCSTRPSLDTGTA